MTQMQEFINRLRSSPYIHEKQFGDISSFNFTRKAFYSGHWNELTMKARGLFINTATEKITARGYDKFFNIDENPQTTMAAIQRKVTYPLEVYKKENGYLGLISWDHIKGNFFFATKSMIEGSYVEDLKQIFFHSGIHVDKVANFLSQAKLFDEAVTLIVEVIDPVLDPHIIEYGSAHLVLLDIVSNTLEPHYANYPLLSVKAFEFGMEVKSQERSIMDWSEVENMKWLCEHPHYFDRNGKPFEGYVFRDSQGYMFKMKTAYYLKWKRYRRYAEMILGGVQPKAESDPFLAWVEQNKDKLEHKSIIDMRNIYEKAHTT